MTKQMTRPAHKGRSSKAPETKAPETKATGNEVATAFEEFMQAFECYKETNDERLSQMEQRVGTDVVTTEKMDRISRSMDEQKRKLDQMIIKGSRPVLGSRSNPLHDDEHKNAFNAYIRRGDENSLRQIEAKAMSSSSDPDGGYLVPNELDQEIGRRLSTLSPIRSISSVRQVTGAVLKNRLRKMAWPQVGLVKQMFAPKQQRLNWLNYSSPLWNFMPCQLPPRHCLKIVLSISILGL